MSQTNTPSSDYERLENFPAIFGIRLGDQPSYEVITNEGVIEVRYYDLQTLASVAITENEDDAFLSLARYIYGQNKDNKIIARPLPSIKNEFMTSFFTTAPLLHTTINGQSTLSFVLPQDFTRTTAPTPLDSQIYLTDKPSHMRAVIKDTEGAEVLLKWIKNHSHYTQVGQIQMALFDKPQTPSIIKRNELHIEITGSLKAIRP